MSVVSVPGRAGARGRSARRARRGAASLAVAAVLAAGGCGGGSQAASGAFAFVSPGGRTDIFYDPPSERGGIGGLSGPDLLAEGGTVSLDDFAGQVVVVNIWGQWCGPCRAEAPELEQVFEDTQALGVRFLGIDVRDPQRDKAQDFVAAYGVGYPSIWDPEMRTLAALGGRYPTSVVPSTLVLDRQHRVAAVFLRALLAEDLEPVVRRVAAEE